LKYSGFCTLCENRRVHCEVVRHQCKDRSSTDSGSIMYRGEVRNIPHENCLLTKEKLLKDGIEGLKWCPYCLRRKLKCEVFFHPPEKAIKCDNRVSSASSSAYPTLVSVPTNPQSVAEFFPDTAPTPPQQQLDGDDEAERESAVDRLYIAVNNMWKHDNRTKKSHLSIVNSTGNGKTYTCIQLGLRLPLVYMLCRETKYQPDPILSLLVNRIDSLPTLAEKNLLSICFVRLLKKHMMRYDNAVSLHRAQFRDKCYRHVGDFLAGLNEEFMQLLTAKKVSPVTKSALKKTCSEEAYEDVKKHYSVLFMNEGADTEDSSAATSGLSAEFSRLEVLVFDEADGLCGNRPIDNEHCALRCIQRAVDACGLIGLFLCTSSRIDLIESTIPSQQNISPRQPPLPFTQVVQHDIFRDHLFHFGRPLWRQFAKSYRFDYNRLVQVALEKLVCKPDNDSVFAIRRSACALFCLRFGFEPVSDSCSDFVSEHLAIMLEIRRTTGSKHDASCKWLSEPILAEASAVLTSGVAPFVSADMKERFSVAEVTKCVYQSITNTQMIAISPGDKGEVVAAALCGYTLDLLRSSCMEEKQSKYNANEIANSMSSPVPLIDFLRALGIKLTEEQKVKLAHYMINCTHFLRLEKEMTEVNCYQAIDRCVGYYVRAGAESVDVVIVAFLMLECGRARFCPVRIQVKNLKTKITKKTAAVWLNNMSPWQKCQPIVEVSDIQVGIVIATGIGGADAANGECLLTTPQKSDEAATSMGGREQSRVRTRAETKGKTPYYGFLLSMGSIEDFTKLRANAAVLLHLQCLAQCHQLSGDYPSVMSGFYEHEKEVEANPEAVVQRYKMLLNRRLDEDEDEGVTAAVVPSDEKLVGKKHTLNDTNENAADEPPGKNRMPRLDKRDTYNGA